jgi:membrane protein involved in colicin uptake
MISRAVVLDKLAITRWFPSINVNRQLSQAYRNEFDRLEKLDQQTEQDFQKSKWAPQQILKPQLP